ncbi:hypothetical protein [Bradyrhizobium sp. 5.13L]
MLMSLILQMLMSLILRRPLKAVVSKDEALARTDPSRATALRRPRVSLTRRL